MAVEVLGRDAAREAYRVAKGQGEGRVVAYLPDFVISHRFRLTGGIGHQTAYDWIATHRGEIDAALNSLRDRKRPRPPYDVMELAED